MGFALRHVIGGAGFCIGRRAGPRIDCRVGSCNNSRTGSFVVDDMGMSPIEDRASSL
jgi:hypothetical protein